MPDAPPSEVPAGAYFSFRTEVNLSSNHTRVNHQIRISPVRLIDADGGQVGVLPLNEAKERAEEAGLDLVEVAPQARPPVCRLMDYGKLKYEEQKKARASRKRQHQTTTKEVKLRPGTEAHDLETKLKHARRFLDKGCKVKVTVRFRGREMRRPELGREVLDQVTEALAMCSSVEQRQDRIEGRQVMLLLAPDSHE